jgi:hypothetical protein
LVFGGLKIEKREFEKRDMAGGTGGTARHVTDQHTQQ